MVLKNNTLENNIVQKNSINEISQLLLYSLKHNRIEYDKIEHYISIHNKALFDYRSLEMVFKNLPFDLTDPLYL
jgi:hypothetical protein